MDNNGCLRNEDWKVGSGKLSMLMKQTWVDLHMNLYPNSKCRLLAISTHIGVLACPGSARSLWAVWSAGLAWTSGVASFRQFIINFILVVWILSEFCIKTFFHSGLDGWHSLKIQSCFNLSERLLQVGQLLVEHTRILFLMIINYRKNRISM